MNKTIKPIIRTLSSALTMIVLTTAIAATLTSCGKDLSASTMRLLRLEGTVKLFEKDKERTITDNLRLNAGNVLNTEAKSLAGIALDDTKIVTIDELSCAQFDQDGKKLDINLTEGSLFFEVTKKLDSDESFDIRTSTMVVGIRGTSGYVAVDDDGHETLIVTDGSVEVKGTNPTTGETKTITVNAGQRVKTYLYNDRTVDSIMFELEDVTEDDLNLFVLERLREDFTLVELVCSDTGWSIDKIMGTEGDDSDTLLADAEKEQDDTASGASTDASTDASDSSASSDSSTIDNSDASSSASSEETQKKSSVSDNIVSVSADGVMTLKDGDTFDPAYYAKQNPDVVSEIGTDPEKLLEHYLTFGKNENRYGTAATQENEEAKKAQEYLEWQRKLSEAEAEAAEKARQDAERQAYSNTGGNTGGEGPDEEGWEPDDP